MTRALLRGGPWDGLERVIQCDVFIVPLMPELPGVFDPELGGWHVTEQEARMPVPAYMNARYHITDEISDGRTIYQYEGEE